MIINSLLRFRNWFRPKKILLSHDVELFLQTMYPDVNWQSVSFYEGLPWFILSSKATAIALPESYSFSKINIHLTSFDENSIDKLGILVHESFHALQYTAIGVSGLGFIRLFMVKYFSFWVANGYRSNPMEIDAYKHEEEFCSCFGKFLTQRNLNFKKEMLAQFSNANTKLIRRKSELSYEAKILNFLLGAFFVFVIGICLPISEFFLWIVYGILSVINIFISNISKRN